MKFYRLASVASTGAIRNFNLTFRYKRRWEFFLGESRSQGDSPETWDNPERVIFMVVLSSVVLNVKAKCLSCVGFKIAFWVKKLQVGPLDAVTRGDNRVALLTNNKWWEGWFPGGELTLWKGLKCGGGGSESYTSSFISTKLRQGQFLLVNCWLVTLFEVQ